MFFNAVEHSVRTVYDHFPCFIIVKKNIFKMDITVTAPRKNKGINTQVLSCSQDENPFSLLRDAKFYSIKNFIRNVITEFIQSRQDDLESFPTVV